MADERAPKQVVIVGGGTAGWMAAAALASYLGPLTRIRLIESDAIGTVGVGEATIPQIRRLNGLLGIDEREMLARTQGTFKLGIEFTGWRAPAHAYLHTFGRIGAVIAQVPFHHYWLRHVQEGGAADLWDFCLNNAAARENRFAHMERVGDSPIEGIAYAYHFDATLYAAFLREVAEGHGVARIEGRIVDVGLHAEGGDVAHVTLENGEAVAGDLFIDCSGFRGLLIGDAVGSAYEDWSQWLPCDRAVAVPCASAPELLPYTRAIARQAGWQWRIPLQHRIGNGHVFCSQFMGEDEATSVLMDALDGEPLAEPRVIRFTTGRRREFWRKNVVALGLSSGFLEPMESTSIHLIQSGVSRLLALFPRGGIAPADVAEYNRQMGREFELIRDFLVLHYHANGRDGQPFWDRMRTMAIPDTLAHKLDLFRANGRIFRDPEDLFTESSWLQVMVGQGVIPSGHNPLADRLTPAQLDDLFASVRKLVDGARARLPRHAEYVARHCAAQTPSAAAQ